MATTTIIGQSAVEESAAQLSTIKHIAIENMPIKEQTAYLKYLSELNFFELTANQREIIKNNLESFRANSLSVPTLLDELGNKIAEKLDLIAQIKLYQQKHSNLEFLEYISSINLENLDNITLNFIRGKITRAKSALKRNRFKLPKWECFGFISELIMFLITFKNGLNFSVLFFCFYFAVTIIKKIYRSNKEYQAFANKARSLTRKINSKLNEDFKEMALERVTSDIEQHNEFIKSQVDKIGHDELMERIDDIESKILLLPREQEEAYQKMLQDALNEYKAGLNNYKNSRISLILGNKLSHLSILQKRLAEIEKELTPKVLFVTDVEFEQELERKTKEYLENIGGFENKWQALQDLEQSFINLIDDDINKNLWIARNFAECFWATIKVCDEQDQGAIIHLMSSTFIDRAIVEGEKMLDNMEQTLEVIAARKELYEMKNSDDYEKKKYLKRLVEILDKLGLKLACLSRNRINDNI